MNKDYYVILTGSKNNAGDYLIKYRAKKLFEQERTDRDVIDLNAWEKFDSKTLDIVNNSKALILMGGPALQKNMYPNVYRLTDTLDDVTAPVVTMGIGWYDKRGRWEDTYNYAISARSKNLLDKIAESKVVSSVRDYHTLNALNFLGYDNYLMTGCPAYYDLSIKQRSICVEKLNRVAFSLGVTFVDNPKMQDLMMSNILSLKNYFKDSIFEVVFHHSLDKEKYLSTPNASKLRAEKHLEFEAWLKKEKIKYVDISGSAENLINYYSGVDIHIGYRVHAHIFMNSIAKLSFLLAEDGRALGVGRVIGGLVFDGYLDVKTGLLAKVLNRLLPFYNRYIPNNNVTIELLNSIEYELKHEFPRANGSQFLIESNYHLMKTFLKQLP